MTPDDILAPRIEHTIEDGEGGQWILAVRPRLKGPQIADQTLVSFRRSWARISGFSIRVWALRKMSDEQEWRDWIAESSIHLTHESAKNALAWLGTISTEGGTG